jgi:hypothetical protein
MHSALGPRPRDQTRVAKYEAGPYAGIADKAFKGLAVLEPAGADPAAVAPEVVRIVIISFEKSVPLPIYAEDGTGRANRHLQIYDRPGALAPGLASQTPYYFTENRCCEVSRAPGSFTAT